MTIPKFVYALFQLFYRKERIWKLKRRKWFAHTATWLSRRGGKVLTATRMVVGNDSRRYKQLKLPYKRSTGK